jgi:site-specific recombinase XerD
MNAKEKQEQLANLKHLATEAEDMLRLRDNLIYLLVAAGVRVEEIIEAADVDWAVINRVRREEMARRNRDGLI